MATGFQVMVALLHCMRIASGSLSLTTNISIVEIGSSVSLQCNFTGKTAVRFFLGIEQICQCDVFLGAITCYGQTANYSTSSDSSAVGYNLYFCTVKSFQKTSCGIYKCIDLIGGLESTTKLHYLTNYGEKCDDCGKCSAAAQICHNTSSICTCQEGHVYVDGTKTCDPKKNCEVQCWFVVALFVFAVLQCIIIIIVTITSICGCCHDASLCLMRIVNIANYVIVLWSIVMVILIYVDCTERPDWCAVLAIFSLAVSASIAVLKIILMLFPFCLEGGPLHDYGVWLRNLHCCEPMKQGELTAVAIVHVMGIGLGVFCTIIGLTFVFCVFCKTTKPKKPGPVMNLKGTPKSTEIKVEWQPPEFKGDDPESLHYKVTCQELGGNSQVNSDIETSDIKHTFDNLNPGKIHVLCVFAVNQGQSEPSTILIRTELGEGVPERIDNETNEVSQEGTSIQVKWTLSGKSINYLVTWAQVFYEDSVVKEKYFENIKSTQSDYTIKDLIPGMLYDVRVYARNEEGYSEPSTKLSRTKPNGVVPIDIKNNTDSRGIDSKSIMAKWDLNYSDIRYLVSWQEVSNMTVSTGKIDYVTVTEKNHVLITGLDPGTLYDVSVYAMNVAGYSKPSKKSLQTKGQEARKQDTGSGRVADSSGQVEASSDSSFRPQPPLPGRLPPLDKSNTRVIR